MEKQKGKKRGAKEEDNNVNADDIPADSREVVQAWKELVDLSEKEIYAILVECNMDPELVVGRLFPKDTSQKDESNQGNAKETTSHSSSQEVGSSSIPNPEISNGCDQGGGNNSDETSNVQGTNNHLADSSTTTSGILDPYNSDITNAETKSMPVSSNEAVPLLSEPSSSDVKNVETKRVPISPGKAVPVWRGRPPSRLISGERTMAEVLKMKLGLSKESVTEAPVKDDPPPLDVTDPLSNSITEPDATRDQLQESEPVATSLQQLSIENDEPVNEEKPQNAAYGLCTQEELDFHIAPDYRPSISMSERNQQPVNHYYYPQVNVPSWRYGNGMMNSPYWPQNQYNMPPPSAFQRHGGSNTSTYYHQSQAYMPPQYRNGHFPQPAHGSANSGINGSNRLPSIEHHQSQAYMPPQYRNSHFPRFNGSNRLPSIEHQDQNSNGWLFAQGNGTYSLDPPHWIQQPPSFRHTQRRQEQQEQEQQPSRGFDYSSQDQQNSRRDPFDRTQ